MDQNALVQQVVEQKLMEVAKVMEEQVDDELHRFVCRVHNMPSLQSLSYLLTQNPYVSQTPLSFGDVPLLSNRLENLGEDDLDKLREKRLQQMKKQQQKRAEWLAKGHGEYREIHTEKVRR